MTGIETELTISRRHRDLPSARDAAALADIRGDCFQRHHRDGAGLLGDAGLFGVDDVHDDATLLHPGEAALDEIGAASKFLEIGFGHTTRFGVTALTRVRWDRIGCWTEVDSRMPVQPVRDDSRSSASLGDPFPLEQTRSNGRTVESGDRPPPQSEFPRQRPRDPEARADRRPDPDRHLALDPGRRPQEIAVFPRETGHRPVARSRTASGSGDLESNGLALAVAAAVDDGSIPSGPSVTVMSARSLG